MELPELEPGKIDPQSTLHEKLLDHLTAADLQTQKAKADSDLEAQKAAIAKSKATLDRQLAEKKEENDGDIASEKAEQDKELELLGKYHDKIAEVAATAIDRARDSAKFVQTAAAAILGTYAALLGLVFSTTERPLPLRGVWAAVFLGLAVALAVAYLGFLKRGRLTHAYEPGPSLAETAIKRTASFVEWSIAGANNRRNALRASVVAFGFGVAFIPAAFVGPIGGVATVALPTPPPIPTAIPPAVADDASRLFGEQVDSYLASLQAASAVQPAPQSCEDSWKIWYACAWNSEAAVEESFLYLAAIAALLVLLVPVAFSIYERIRR